ncbi:MAG: adenylate kinase family protein [bacterium]
MKIAITGVPCVGKTTVSKLLAKRLKYKYMNINELAENLNAYIGYDKKLKSKIVDVKKISKEIDKMKNDIVLDGHFSHEFKVDTVIILRCNPKILEKRLKKKYPKNPFKVKENVDTEILGVITSEVLKLNKKFYEIDTTNKKSEEIVGKIIELLKNRPKILIGEIDWLRMGFEPSK